jgi:hypothetical protein
LPQSTSRIPFFDDFDRRYVKKTGAPINLHSLRMDLELRMRAVGLKQVQLRLTDLHKPPPEVSLPMAA